MSETRDLARAALTAAISRHVDEPVLVTPDGRRFSESELRHLEQQGALATLEDMAAAAAHFLRVIKAARFPAFGPLYHVTIVTGLGWGDDPPPGTEYLLPAGWQLQITHYPFGDETNEHRGP